MVIIIVIVIILLIGIIAAFLIIRSRLGAGTATSGTTGGTSGTTGSTGGTKPGNGACVARGAPVYVGCGYAYGSLDQVKKQCGDYRTFKFIGDGIDGENPCKLPRASKMYMGCGYIYGDEAAYKRSCPTDNAGTALWISDGL